MSCKHNAPLTLSISVCVSSKTSRLGWKKSQYILQYQKIHIDSALPPNAQTPFNAADSSNNVLYNHPFLLSPNPIQGHPLYVAFTSLSPPSMEQFLSFSLSFLTWHLKRTDLLLCWTTFSLWLAGISSRLHWGCTLLAGKTQTGCCVLIGSFWGQSMSICPTACDFYHLAKMLNY